MGTYNYSGGNNNVGSACQDCTLKNEVETEEEPLITIRACLFFDGTLNNRTNVTVGLRLKDSKRKFEEYLKKLNITEKDFSEMLRLSTKNDLFFERQRKIQRRKINDSDFEEIITGVRIITGVITGVK